MSRYSQNWIKTSLIIFTLSVQAFGARTLLNKTLVIVNDDVILDSDVQAFKKKATSPSFQELFGGLSPDIASNDQKILQVLVEEKIIDQQVKKLELTASDKEVGGQINAILSRNQISEGQLRSRLSQLGTSLEEYRSGIKRQTERRKLIDMEIKPTLEVAEEQLQHYYLQNSNETDAQTSYRIAHLMIAAGPGGAARAQTIYKEVKASPNNFDQLVKDYSDDTSTSESGGELGFFTTASLSSEFRKVVPGLKAGEISPPIKTEAGFHIVKLLETKKGSFSELSNEKKEELRAGFLSREVERKMRLWLERKKSESYIRFSSEGYNDQ